MIKYLKIKYFFLNIYIINFIEFFYPGIQKNLYPGGIIFLKNFWVPGHPGYKNVTTIIYFSVWFLFGLIKKINTQKNNSNFEEYNNYLGL